MGRIDLKGVEVELEIGLETENFGARQRAHFHQRIELEGQAEELRPLPLAQDLLHAADGDLRLVRLELDLQRHGKGRVLDASQLFFEGEFLGFEFLALVVADSRIQLVLDLG